MAGPFFIVQLVIAFIRQSNKLFSSLSNYQIAELSNFSNTLA
jgi:hypothetical protein